MTTAVAERKITRKYVVLKNRVTGHYMVGCTLMDRYHMDIFGERPAESVGEDWYPHSAGSYTWVYNQPETLTVHGRSDGFHIHPATIDIKLLKQYLDPNMRETEFDAEGNPLD